MPIGEVTDPCVGFSLAAILVGHRCRIIGTVCPWGQCLRHCWWAAGLLSLVPGSCPQGWPLALSLSGHWTLDTQAARPQTCTRMIHYSSQGCCKGGAGGVSVWLHALGGPRVQCLPCAPCYYPMLALCCFPSNGRWPTRVTHCVRSSALGPKDCTEAARPEVKWIKGLFVGAAESLCPP